MDDAYFKLTIIKNLLILKITSSSRGEYKKDADQKYFFDQ